MTQISDIELTDEQVGLLIKIAHGLPIGEKIALLKPLETDGSRLWEWGWLGREQLTDRGRALLAKQREDV